MKKLTIIILCLLLSACGQFNFNVQVAPNATQTAQVQATLPVETLSPSPDVSSLATPPFNLYQGAFNVLAYIDGHSQLVLQGPSIHWHHIDGGAPGRSNSQNLATVINDLFNWSPSWPDSPNSNNDNCNCDSSTYSQYISVLPAWPQKVSFQVYKGRGKVSISQQPSQANAYTLVVDFDDNGQMYGDWYDVRVSYLTSLISPTPFPGRKPDSTATVGAGGGPVRLASIQMGANGQGWAVDSSGHILKTGDGASTWKNVTPSQGEFNVHGLFALNAETAWAAPSQPDVSNVVWLTRDGGVTWEHSQPIALGDGSHNTLGLQFPNARDGWLLLLATDDSQNSHVLLYKSVDGGENWEQVSSLLDSVAQSYLPDTHTTMAFFDGQSGSLGGWWGKNNPNQWMVLKTVDGGATWKTEALDLPGDGSFSCNARSVTEIEPGAIAVDMPCTQASDPKFRYHHLFYLSATGSPVWRSWKLSGEFRGVDFVNANQGWMLVAPGGPLSEIHRTTDGGKTWTNINIVAWKQAQFNFVNGGEGWAIVSDGSAEALVHTVNGGMTWEEIKPVLANP